MKRKKYLFILFAFFIAGMVFPKTILAQKKVIFDEKTIREQAAQMLIIGFRGTVLTPENSIYNDIKIRKIGGIILFDYDVPSKSRPRNISSKEQLTKLIADLQTLSSRKLFISIDQEGGKVNRLRTQYGFPAFVSAGYLGQLNNEDSTRFWAVKTSKTLSELGFNLNFSPCLDVNINKDCPVIGKIERSFSDDPKIVSKHAAIWIEEQSKENVYSVIKHFPGHGSSATDTHLQFTDVTTTWQICELEPYQTLISQNKCDFIMTSHVMNKRFDSINPATLSYAILTDLLRNQLDFKGIIISDDMDMGAIKQTYSLAKALEKGINAGINMFIFSNNGTRHNPKLTEEILDTIVELVESGKVTPEKITESYMKIIQYK